MLRDWESPKALFDAGTHPQQHGDDVDEATARMGRQGQEADTRRQIEKEVEMLTEDPLASPGASSINSGHFGGWSIGPGIVEKESVDINPFDDDEEYENGDATKRSSSPREGHFTSHGLSMVKEDDREENNHQNSPGGNVFDEIDLEAFPEDSSSTKRTTRQDKSQSGNNYGIKGNIANRVIQEFQTNPKFKFQVLVALSMMLVASCLIAAIVAAPNENAHSTSNEEERAVDLSDLLDGLHVDTPKPTSTPTKSPYSTPIVKQIVKQSSAPSVIRTEYPTLLPTMYPTFATLNPSVNASVSQMTSKPSLLANAHEKLNSSMYPTISTLNPSADTDIQLKTSSPSSLSDIDMMLKTAEPSSLGHTTALSKSSQPSPSLTRSTFQPSKSMMTYAPTRDCTDSSGEFMTYNDKPRTCEWLDNGFNGAKSDRKDMNCKTSDLGKACKYTCRLYNGCMEYFLQSTEDFSNERDFSVGNPCADKDGSFISNGGMPRTCTWLDEDSETAAEKKDLNCGTPDNARTELGTMCPGSCAGFNSCTISSDGTIKYIKSQPQSER